METEDVKICTSPQQSLDDEAFSPESRELFTINECDEEVEVAQSNDEPDSPEPQQLSPIHQSYLEFGNDQQDHESLEGESPEPRRLFPFRHESPVPKYDDDEKDDESLRSDSPEPRRLFPVHQFHSTVYDPPQPASQTETYCPAPLRRFWTPEERLKFDAFEDWFVPMNECTTINATSENPISEISSFPFRHETPVPEYENDDRNNEPESPEPRRLFPVHQFHSAVYDPPKPTPQMETFCPGPMRRFLTPEERLKFDVFED